MVWSVIPSSIERIWVVVLGATGMSTEPGVQLLLPPGFGKIERPHCAEPWYLPSSVCTADWSDCHFDMVVPGTSSFIEPDSSTTSMTLGAVLFRLTGKVADP